MTLPRTLIALLTLGVAPPASLALPASPTVRYARLIPADDQTGAQAIALDVDGNAYLTGSTCSPGYWHLSSDPTAVLDPFGGGCDAFVTKVGPDGALVYSTFIGGTAGDAGRAIAVDAAGNAYVAGSTLSPSIAGETGLGFQDAFVAKLDPGGSRAWLKRLGGASIDEATGIAVDQGGNVLVVGHTWSADFPVTGNALRGSYPPNTTGGAYIGTGFIARYDPAGNLTYGSYFTGAPGAGGLAYRVNAVAVDAAGSPYLAGFATSAADTTSALFAGGTAATHPAAFVAKLDPTATAVVYETYFGGDGHLDASHLPLDSLGRDYLDEAFAIAVIDTGEAFVTGVAGSPDFPTILCSAGPGCTPLGGRKDAFVMHLFSNGVPGPSRLLGGGADDQGVGIGVGGPGAPGVRILGTTLSTDLPVTDGSRLGGFDTVDTFLVSFDEALATTEFAAYVGGAEDDLGTCLAANAAGDVAFAGTTVSGTFSSTFPLSNSGPVGFAVPFVARLGFATTGTLSLALSADAGYLSTTGVVPAAAPPAGPFTLKVVVLDTGNRPPASVRACIDATCWNMSLDPGAGNDGNFVNGEQYAVAVALPAGTAEGQHKHYFIATDGVTTVTLPATGQLAGPVVDATPPTLTVTNPTWRTRVAADADRLPLDPAAFGVAATDAGSPPVALSADLVDGLAVPAGYLGLPRGPHQVRWRGVDAAGNAATLTQQVIVDTPSTVYSSPVPGSSTLIDVSATGHVLGSVSVTASPPPGQGLSFGTGTISFVVSCPPPGTVSVVLRFTPALPAGIQPAKVNGATTTAIPAGSWSRIDAGGATLVTLALVDNGPLDQDGGVVGSITDPVAVGEVVAPPAPPRHSGCAHGGGGLPALLGLLGAVRPWRRRRPGQRPPTRLQDLEGSSSPASG